VHNRRDEPYEDVGCTPIWGAYLVCDIQPSGSCIPTSLRLVHARNAASLKGKATQANRPDNQKAYGRVWFYLPRDSRFNDNFRVPLERES
jgi:hypothetical protein